MKKYNYLIVTLLAAGLAACSNQDEDLMSVYQQDSDAVRVTATIAGIAETRANTAASGNAWDDGDQICVTSTTADAISSKATYQYNSNDKTWQPTEERYILWADGANSFQAYYPTADYASYTSFVLPADQSGSTPTDANYIGKADWMLAEKTNIVKPADGKLDLNFKHQLAKVTVTINGYGKQYETTKPTITAPKFTVPTPLTSSAISMENSATTVTALTQADNTDAHHSYIVVLPPGKYTAGETFLTLAIDGIEYPVKVTGDVLTSTGLQAGKAYVFSLTVGKDAMNLGTVSVNNWNDTDWRDNGGIADELLGKINATNMTTKQLKSKIILAVESGETDFTITLPADASAEVCRAIFDAFIDSKASDGSINLTLNGVTKIPNNAFYNNDTKIIHPYFLKTVTLSDAEEIGYKAFSAASYMTNISIPKVKKIGKYAFWECSKITEFNAPELTELGEHALLLCSELTTVNLPKVTTIGGEALFCCSKLTSITFGNLSFVDHLDNGLFSYRSPTRNVNITLHLSSDQKTMEKGRDNIWRPTGAAYKDSEYHKNKSFIGYIFKDVIVGE